MELFFIVLLFSMRRTPESPEGVVKHLSESNSNYVAVRSHTDTQIDHSIMSVVL